MALELLNHRFRKEKSLFKPFFVFEEAPEGGPQSDTEAGKETETMALRAPELLAKSPLLDQIIEITTTYNSLKSKISDDLYLVFIGDNQEILDLKATLTNINGLLEASRVRVGKKEKEILANLKGLLQETLQKQGGAEGLQRIGALEAMDGNEVRVQGQLLADLETHILSSHTLHNETGDNIVYHNLVEHYDASLQRVGEFDHLREGGAASKALFLTLIKNETGDFSQALNAEEVNQKMIFLEAAKKEVEQGGAENLHPSIRDHVMVRFYKNFEKGEENAIGNAWVLEQLNHSPYFHETLRDPAASTRRAALELAFAGGRAAQELGVLENYVASVDRYNNIDLDWDTLTNGFGIQLTDADKGKNPQTVLEERMQAYLKRMELLSHFLNAAQAILQQPYDEQGAPHELLDQFNQEGDKALGYGELGFIQPGQLLSYSQESEAFELNKNTNILGARVQRGADIPTAFESMGMDLQYAFNIYLREIATHPDLKTSQWDAWMEKDPNRLADLIQAMTVSNAQNEGRKAFLTVLRSMNTPSNDPHINYFRQVARNRVNDLKNYIEHQTEAMADKQDAMKLIKKEIEGSSLSVKDHLMNGFNTLVNKLFSGNPVDMALAGGTIFLIGSLVAGAVKNRNEWYGKLGIAGIFGLGGALWYEDISGEKLFDHAKKILPGGLEKAAENTPELALVDEGEKHMNQLERPISRDEHLRGLITLHDVPYHKVMEWYQSTKTTEPDYDPMREERLFRGLGIQENQVVLPGGDKIENHERTKYIIKASMAQSIESVAHEKKVSNYEAEAILTDTWIKPVKEKGFVSPQKGVVQYPNLYEQYHQNPNKLTFGRVIQAQMSLKRSREMLIQKTEVA